MTGRAAQVRASVLAFGAAFVLSVVGTTGLVTVVARTTAGGDASRVAEAEKRFALSSVGLMACGCLEGLLLLGVALVAAHGSGVRAGAAQAETTRDGMAWLRLRGAAPPALVWGATVAGLVGLTFAVSAALDLAARAGVFGARAGVLELLAGALRGLSGGRLALAVVTLALVPAVGEEALFRGFVQRGLVAGLGRWPGIAATSLAFGLMHRDLVQGAGAVVAGVFLGWVVEAAGSLGPAIAAHAANNATFVALAAAGAAGGRPGPVEALALAAGAAFCASAVIAIRASTRAS